MDFEKYLHMLSNRGLFFPYPRKLRGPLEGGLPRKAALRAIRYMDTPQAAKRHEEYLKNQCVVSCWHEMEHESEAMWRLYAGRGPGVAIKTSFESLLKSLNLSVAPDDSTYMAGRVTYVDYEKDDIPLGNGMPVFYKRMAFSHEHEVRIVRPVNEDKDSSGAIWNAEIDELIHEVVLSPFAEDWMFELVRLTTSSNR